MIPTKDNCLLALNALAVFESTSLLTEDELLCLSIVREAIQAISLGEDLSHPIPGSPFKKRLLRRVAVSWFHHTAPREKLAPAPLPTLQPPPEQEPVAP